MPALLVHVFLRCTSDISSTLLGIVAPTETSLLPSSGDLWRLCATGNFPSSIVRRPKYLSSGEPMVSASGVAQHAYTCSEISPPVCNPHLMCVCGDDSLSAADGRAVWPCPGAARHVDEPTFIDSPTLNVYPLTADLR